MQNKSISLPISFSVNNEISDKNNRFIDVTIDVLHTGLNYNGSIFDKEVVDANIETIKNTPILGFITEVPYDDKDFKGHEYVITKTDKDGIVRKYIGSAYGVIPESCNPRWITKTTDSGVEREFLQVDGILWTKFKDATDIMLEDVEKPESMELYPYDIDGYENDDGDFVFTKFSFDGCCILGSTVEPAKKKKKIEVRFTMSDFVKSIQSELNDKYSAFTKIVNDANQTFTKLTEVVNEKTNGGVEIMDNTDFAQTLLSQFEDISAQVRQHETFTDRWGYECARYYAVDIQENEVIVVDAKNNYNYFGLSFTMNGDKAEINFETAKRKKLRYEDYVEGSSVEGAFDFGKHIEEIENNAFAKIEEANTKVSEAENKVVEFEAKVSEFETAKNEIEEKFNQVNAEFEEMKPKYEDFVKAEQARIEAELDAQKDAEFAKYEVVLADDVNFAALKERKSELTVKEIESECAIMYARKNLAQANFSRNNDGVMTAGIINDGAKEGFVETKYGYIPVR